MIKQTELIKINKWKTMIVLDACRYDIFKEINNINGSLFRVNSESHQTSTWYENHWTKNFNEDTILVSAHPMMWWTDIHKSFFKAIYVDSDNNNKDWKDPFYTFEKALEIRGDYFDKKLLIHLIPPHLPFRGVEGKKFNEKIGYFDDIAWLKKYDGGKDILELVNKYGQSSKDNWLELRKYYMENLQISIDGINRYLSINNKKVVITADHGELIGEFNTYGHRYHKDGLQLLKTVPWLRVSEK